MKQPNWITEPLTPYDIAAINQGGCASGAYMPAVTYHQAREIMNEHGDDVLDYIQTRWDDDLPSPPHDVSWSQIATFYLSFAIELFAMIHEEQGNWEDDTYPIEA